MVTWTDNSILPFGVHKGKKLANIPASWFLWIKEQKNYDKTSPLGRYIEANLLAFQLDILDDKNYSK